MQAAERFTLPNARTVICACSASHARLWLAHTRRGDWTLVSDLKDTEATQPEQDRVSDRPGRTFDRRGGGRHTMEPTTSARDHDKECFARTIAAELNQAVAAGTAQHLVLIAGPKFLGLLRDALSAPATAAVAVSISKNLSQLDADAIRKAAKPLVGYSDITTLLLWQRKKAGLLGIHGPMCEKPGSLDGEAGSALVRALQGTGPLPRYEGKTVAEGWAEGRLVGGSREADQDSSRKNLVRKKSEVKIAMLAATTVAVVA